MVSNRVSVSLLRDTAEDPSDRPQTEFIMFRVFTFCWAQTRYEESQRHRLYNQVV